MSTRHGRHREPPRAPQGRLSLGRKIGLGFAVVLILHVSIAVLGHVGLERDKQKVDQLDQGRRLTVQMVELDRKVGALQNLVLAYAHSGARGQESPIFSAHAHLLQSLSTAQDHAPAGDQPDLDLMRERLVDYLHQFRAAVDDRERCRRLVEVELPAIKRRTETLLAEILDSSGTEGDAALILAQNALLRIDNDVGQYLHQLDASALRRARSGLESLLSIACTYRAVPARSDAEKELTGSVIPRYGQVLTSIMQSTRGYLHLTKVVMAGDAQEFLRLSNRLRTEHLANLDALVLRINEEQSRFQSLSAFFSVLTILLGLLASRIIGHSVVSPLLGMTRTMTRLAAGHVTESIPSQGRRDEIGSLARAAQVFRDKNEETARLLVETRRLAEEHEAVILDLEESNRELDQFAHAASHDLKAPLRALSTLCEWIEDDVGNTLPEKTREDLGLLKGRVARMGRLLDDLLQFSRAGREECALEVVDVLDLARNVVMLVQPPANFLVELRGHADPACLARIPLQVVLGNLLSNAIKHHDREQGRVSLEVEVEGDEAVFTVADDGPGIPLKFHEEIFRPFRTLRPRDEVEASGMGLALVKKFVDRFGGSIELRSEEGRRGSTFVVRWPIEVPVIEPALPLEEALS